MEKFKQRLLGHWLLIIPYSTMACIITERKARTLPFLIILSGLFFILLIISGGQFFLFLLALFAVPLISYFLGLIAINSIILLLLPIICIITAASGRSPESLWVVFNALILGSLYLPFLPVLGRKEREK
ncbi:hypothetical protein KAR04_07000 [Candidatus Calescamantes bacterium]|nr:hypothetical protein [Candidatus Calescamantes bacterium]MCK5598503.1 hypothetical protein [bacterium]